MASRVLVSGSPGLSLPFLRGPDLPVSPVSRGSSGLPLTPPRFPPTEAPLQTLHMDVWGPARVRGQGHERYFVLVVDDYSRYTTVFPLRSKGDVTELNLHPRVSRPETSPALLWTGKVGDASAFRVWGSRAFVRDLSADKLSPRAAPCVFLGFPPDAPGWQFYHPSSRRVLSSQDVTFDESVPFYRLFPYRTPSLPRHRTSLCQVPPRLGCAASGAAEPGGVEPAATGPPLVASGGTRPGGSPGVSSRREPLSLHRSCASGLLAAGGVLLELALLRAAEGAGAAGPELLGLRVRLELELLRVLVLRLLLSVLVVVVLRVLLALLEVLPLEVQLALVLPEVLRVLVLSLRAWCHRAASAVLRSAPSAGSGLPPLLEGPPPVQSHSQLPPPPHCLLPLPTLVLLEVLVSVVSLRLVLRRFGHSSCCQPIVTRLLATVVNDPSFESTDASALLLSSSTLLLAVV
ncbi:unnamed protein product [Closterium sp. NIES-64]|nr:unnamed protein product [Closterium sp. NIES-64]